jgi:hypothetical protein
MGIQPTDLSTDFFGNTYAQYVIAFSSANKTILDFALEHKKKFSA